MYKADVTTQQRRPVVDVIVPARNDAATLGDVLARLPHRRVRTVMVVDNGSTDATSQVARDAGVVVLREARGGYGAACQYAIAHLAQLPQPPDVVAFVPGDGRADPGALIDLLRAIEEEGAELAIGLGEKRRHGDRAIARLIETVYRAPVRGVGTGAAMRAIRYPALIALGMSDRGSGWDVEMLVRALKLGLVVVELPIAGHRVRHGGRAHALADRAAERGRSLFHILRHATLR